VCKKTVVSASIKGSATAEVIDPIAGDSDPEYSLELTATVTLRGFGLKVSFDARASMEGTF
jgi:hypothetical protein